MTRVSRIVDRGLTFDFEPPVEVGSQEISTIADLTRIAIHGSKDVHPVIRNSINRQINTLLDIQNSCEGKETALNIALAGKHVVSISR